MATQSAAQHLISGAMSGLASSVVLQPLDLVKTQLQRGGNGKGIAGILGIAKNTVDKKGVTGLWRGLTPTVARPEANLASGACTRVAVGFLLSPLAVLKTRFESGAFEYTSIPQGLRSLVQTSGIRGLWQGFLPSVFRDAPYAGLFVASYEAAKNHGACLPRLQLSTAVQVRRNRNREGDAGLMGHPRHVCRVIRHFMTHPFDMVKESGLLGFYSGMSLRMTRKMCSSAIGWTVYEGMLLAFKKRDELLRQREERHESLSEHSVAPQYKNLNSWRLDLNSSTGTPSSSAASAIASALSDIPSTASPLSNRLEEIIMSRT
ncbi:Mitochondrial carrier [Rhizoctonia solani]|uniref:Mitochondrial carrier n=1 Tax=Rhizoctonia solani TaxID=456999 RepID=A0A8H7IML0_9AGAM|nr:Mitochondrial carrier [Rhizoctonia solani]